MKHSILMAAAALILAACMHEPQGNLSPAAETSGEAFNYDSVFIDNDRPSGDFEQYELRKSREVLAFTGVEPGMRVVDMEAGGGLYTELFSRVVGVDGKVFMQNPPEFDAFLGNAVEERMDGRLDNVTHIKVPFDDMDPVGDEIIDIVAWFLGPHELWYTPEGAEPGALGDPEATFAEISRILKPGGHFVVIDHSAPEGSPPTTGGETHRLDKNITIEMASRVGLVLVAENDLLANPEDDRTVQVFDPSVRRKTDRYLLKFEKL